MSKVLLTGGAGFIGSHIADKLIERGDEVVIVDNLSTGSEENINKEARFYEMDICDNKISEVFEKEKPDFLCHQAAQINVRASVEDPTEDARINILGSLNLLQNCVELGVKKVIFASSGGAIYGDTDKIPTGEDHLEFPISPYGIAKLSIEKYLYYYKEIFNLDYIALRYANVYGPRQNSKGEAGVVAIFCDKILRGEAPIINGDGVQTRDYVFVDDVRESNILALNSAESGVFNIATAKETNVNELYEKIIDNFDQKIEPVHGEAKQGEQKRSCLDWGLAKERLGWQPKTELDEGIKKTVQWFRGQ